ncbi:hypothetical protein QZH41_019331 [Actinostola sp. cb2023]|nr:hypothetical protein QZH41_019331 [Actinostola sp. cb2023]
MGLRGLWLWTITILSFALFLRGEEPLRLKVKHLKLPPNYDLKSVKLPQRIDVKIPWSKADRRAKGEALKGNIFPRVSKNNIKLVPRSAHGVSNYRKTFRQMCQYSFGKKYTTNSIRRSADQWAARCGADDSTIKIAGRW